jgi:hypothetical protein
MFDLMFSYLFCVSVIHRCGRDLMELARTSCPGHRAHLMAPE